MLFGNISDHPHFALIQHNTGGVTGVGDEDGTGILGDQAFDPLAVSIAVPLLRTGGQCTDPSAGCMYEGGIVGIIGLRNDDLCIGIENAQAGQKQRLTTACGDQNIVGIQLNTQLVIIIPHSIDQNRHTGGLCIGKGAAVKTADGIIVSLRGLQIRLADIQMIDGLSVFFCLHRHGVEFAHRRRLASICID